MSHTFMIVACGILRQEDYVCILPELCSETLTQEKRYVYMCVCLLNIIKIKIEYVKVHMMQIRLNNCTKKEKILQIIILPSNSKD